MNWIKEKKQEIEKAVIEINNANLSSETKSVVLNVLRDELSLLRAQSLRINNEKSFVSKGFKK